MLTDRLIIETCTSCAADRARIVVHTVQIVTNFGNEVVLLLVFDGEVTR